MSPEERESFILETWRQEANNLFKAGRSAVELTLRMLALGLTVLTAAASVGLARDHPEVMLAVPAVLSLRLAYQLQVFADVVVMGIARRELERALQAHVGTQVMLFETSVAPLRHGAENPSVRAIQVFTSC